MKRLSKKIIAVITLSFFLFFGPGLRPAHAWVPLIMAGIYGAGSLAAWIEASCYVHVAAAGAYAWYHSRVSNKKKVDPNGNIYRDVNITWVDLKNGKPVAKTGSLISRLNYNDIINILNSNPDKYIQLQHAYFKNRIPIELEPGMVNQNIGDYVKYGAYQGTVTYKNGPNCSSPVGLQNPGVSCSPYQVTGFQCVVRQLNQQGTAWQCATTYRSLGEIPNPEPRTSKESAKILANEMSELLSSKDIYSDRYGNEIDDFLKDNPQIIEILDGNIEQPENSSSAQLPSFPSKSAVDNAGGGGVNPGGGSGNSGGGVGGPGFPNNPFPADDDGDGVPDDSDGDGIPDEGGTEDGDEIFPGIPGPGVRGPYAGDDPDFGKRVSDFFVNMKKSGIFALPGQMFGSIPGGGSSTFSFTAGRFGSFTYDFASWGNILEVLRSLYLICMTVCGIRIVTKGDGG